MEAAASSERRSSSARSARPSPVRRAVLTRPSAWLCSTTTSPSFSSDPQQPAQVSRVEVKPRPQPADIGTARADLPQQARLTERAVAGQEGVVERADPLRNGPVLKPRTCPTMLESIL